MGGVINRNKQGQNELLDSIAKINQITSNDLFKKKVGASINLRYDSQASFIKKLINSKIIVVEFIKVNYSIISF
jgi:hypothetical protein